MTVLKSMLGSSKDPSGAVQGVELKRLTHRPRVGANVVFGVVVNM